MTKMLAGIVLSLALMLSAVLLSSNATAVDSCVVPPLSDPAQHVGPQCGDANRGKILYGQIPTAAVPQVWACNQCHSNNPLTDTLDTPAPAPSLIRAAPRNPDYIDFMMNYQPEAKPIILAMEACCIADRPPTNYMGDLGDLAEFFYTCKMGIEPCVTDGGGEGGGGGGGGGGTSPGALQGPAPINFGNVDVGTTSAATSLTLTNIGSTKVNVTGVTTSNATEFAIVANWCAAVAPANSCDIVLTFRPSAAGTRSATVTVTSDGLGSPQAFSLTGTGIAGSNFAGLWWKAPANSESGWGINLAHQGDAVFATWYTYDTGGKAWWLSMLANRTAPTGNAYSGPIYTDTGPAFNNFVGSGTPTQVGTGTLTFADANNGSFAYTVNGTTQTKAITRYDLGTGPQPMCTYSAAPSLAAATNYQDLWWVAGGAESGWGINFAHQGNSVFATWYTYDAGGSPLWLSVLAPRVGTTNVYNGTLYRSSGPRFDAYDMTKWLPVQVGTATFTFADGNHATFDYATNGAGGLPAVTQSKQVTRYLFAAPAGTVCN